MVCVVRVVVEEDDEDLGMAVVVVVRVVVVVFVFLLLLVLVCLACGLEEQVEFVNTDEVDDKDADADACRFAAVLVFVVVVVVVVVQIATGIEDLLRLIVVPMLLESVVVVVEACAMSFSKCLVVGGTCGGVKHEPTLPSATRLTYNFFLSLMQLLSSSDQLLVSSSGTSVCTFAFLFCTLGVLCCSPTGSGVDGVLDLTNDGGGIGGLAFTAAMMFVAAA